MKHVEYNSEKCQFEEHTARLHVFKGSQMRRMLSLPRGLVGRERSPLPYNGKARSTHQTKKITYVQSDSQPYFPP